jgi:hypothetical protein
MTAYDELWSLLDHLEKLHLRYALDMQRPDAIRATVAVPGERWEIEVLLDGEIEIEVFRSDGIIHDRSKLVDLERLAK